MSFNKNDVPLFSVIVPVYNVKKYVGLTLNSISGQTFTNFEVLVIDDGSTDGSGELLDDIAAKDPRIRVFHQPNAGVSAARNLGLDEAKGEWIVFVDGDDALRKNALEVLADCIYNNPRADVISYESVHMKEIPSIEIEQYDEERTNIEQSWDCSSIVPFESLNHYVVWSETFKRNALGSLRFESMRNGEDVLFCNGIGLRTNFYVKIDRKLYIYRLLREGGAYSNEWSVRVYDDFYRVQNGILENIQSCNKIIDNRWIRRWIGTLLYYRREIWQFDNRTRQQCFKSYRDLIINAGNLHNTPKFQKIWIKIATMYTSINYFSITAMIPMYFYNKLRQFI